MRVLQVTPLYFPNLGGIEVVVKQLSELLVEKGIDVVVYSIDLRSRTVEEEDVNGVLVKRFQPLIGDPLYLPQTNFIKAVRNEKADVIHVHNVHTLLPTLTALAKRNRQKLLLQPHYHRFGQTIIRNFLLRIYRNSLDKLVFPRTRFVIVNSSHEESMIKEDFPHCSNIVLIPQGIQLTELKAVKWRPEKEKRILSVGVLRRQKNIDRLLEAFAYLVKEKEGEQFKLVIVGDGPERERLISSTRKIGVEGFVEWKHSLSRQELLAEYARARVFVSLSTLESFGRVMYEAILIGVPTVVPIFGATANLVEKGLVEGIGSLDPKVIANTILRAAEKPPVKNAEIPETFLTWDEYTERILELYQKPCQR